MTPEKHLQSDKVFEIKIKSKIKTVVPVNGETHFNQLGLSHGFVHFADPITGEYIGYCGTQYFDDNAREVGTREEA